LAEYFSDEEEDSWDDENLSSEGDTWSQPDFNELEDFPNQEHTPSRFDTAIFRLQTINETSFENQGETSYINSISSLSEETKLTFSAWRPFIPREHAFRNCVARSWPSDFSPQASSSQEPTLIQISTITTTKTTPAPTQPTLPRQPETPLSPLKDWHSYRPAMKPSTRNWMKPWPEFTKTYSRVKNSPRELPDHPERSKQYRLWKRQSTCSPRTTQNQNTRCQNTPQVTDAGREPQGCIQFQSQTSSNTKSETSTTGIRSWGTKWHKFSIRTPTYQTKLQKNTKHRQKNSERTPLWLWLPGPCPPICSLSTATTENPARPRKISPRGESHFSKRRSESESYGKYKSINERHRSRNRNKTSKSESKSESKCIKAKSENKIVTFSTEIETNVTAKADEVKAMRKTQTEFRMKLGKQLDKSTGSEVPVTLPLHFATTFNISILICICVTFTIFISIFNIFIVIFNSIFLDRFDHHFQTFSLGSLRVYEMLCASQKTASSQARRAVTAFATPDSIRSLRVPETRPNTLYRSLHRNPLVPKQIHSLGRSRNSENDLYNDSFVLIYLDLSR
jgi:hypothetical protein